MKSNSNSTPRSHMGRGESFCNFHLSDSHPVGWADRPNSIGLI